MNRLKLLEYNAKHIIYQYIPEDSGEAGEVVFNINTGEISIAKPAQNDEFGKYGHKAVKRVEEYIEKKNLPMEAVQAWY